MGKINSRAKGHTFERDLCHDIPQALGRDERGFRGFQQLPGGMSGVADVNIQGLNRLWIEAKRGKVIHHQKAFNQAVCDSRGTSRIPLVIYRYDRDDAKVTCRLKDWLEIAIEIVRYAGYEVKELAK